METDLPSDQVIIVLEATIVFLLLTNALSVGAALYAFSVATGLDARGREAKALVMSKANAAYSAVWPRSRR